MAENEKALGLRYQGLKENCPDNDYSTEKLGDCQFFDDLLIRPVFVTCQEDSAQSLRELGFPAISLPEHNDFEKNFSGKSVYYFNENPLILDVVREIILSLADSFKSVDIPDGHKTVCEFIKKVNGKNLDVKTELAFLFEKAKTETFEQCQKQEQVACFESEAKELLTLGIVEREIRRAEISKKYGITKRTIDIYIKELESAQGAEENTEIVSPVDPWDQPVDGFELIGKINNLLQRHVVLPENTSGAIAAWVLLTYCYDFFRVLPILGIISPEKRCGKTTLLEVLQGVCNRALVASNISSAAVYRTIEKHQPTLLIDEADTFLRDNEELRGVLNSGHTKSTAYVIRVQGDAHEPAKFSTWGPKAIAMIGKLPDTLKDRSVIVSLRRKVTGERVKKLGANFEFNCSELRQKCQRWINDNMANLKTAKPFIPSTGNDRLEDNWTPLLCIAHVVGGQWPDVIQGSMLASVLTEDDTISNQLLSDVREIFKDHTGEKIFSDDLVEKLKSFEDHPWNEWNQGKGLSQSSLARLLKPFGVYSQTLRIGEDRRKGYEKSSFYDAFKRYLLALPPIQTVTTLRASKHKALDDFQTVTDKGLVTDEKRPKPSQKKECHVVTDEKRVSWKIKEEVF